MVVQNVCLHLHSETNKEKFKVMNNQAKSELLRRIGSQLMQSFIIERDRSDKDFRADAIFNTAIFNALGDAMEDLDSVLHS